MCVQAYHLVPGKPLFKADLSDGLKLKTANNGEELTVSGSPTCTYVVHVSSSDLDY
jgi:hypothetical protein